MINSLFKIIHYSICAVKCDTCKIIDISCQNKELDVCISAIVRRRHAIKKIEIHSLLLNRKRVFLLKSFMSRALVMIPSFDVMRDFLSN